MFDGLSRTSAAFPGAAGECTGMSKSTAAQPNQETATMTATASAAVEMPATRAVNKLRT